VAMDRCNSAFGLHFIVFSLADSCTKGGLPSSVVKPQETTIVFIANVIA
jgi:hypothetical protein